MENRQEGRRSASSSGKNNPSIKSQGRTSRDGAGGKGANASRRLIEVFREMGRKGGQGRGRNR